jgi:hypothetical protein
MADSQIVGTNINIDVIPNNIVEEKRICQEVQATVHNRRSDPLEQMRLEQAKMIDWICILLIFTSIIASALCFCITKSVISFSFLSLNSLLPSLRRRKEEAIFPISGEDLQIKLKELDVERERVKQQSKSPYLPLFSWLKHFTRK